MISIITLTPALLNTEEVWAQYAVIPIKVGEHPQNVEYNPSNGNMYGTSISDSDGSGNVFVIDSDTDKVIQIVDVGDNPVDIKYNPSNGDIYVVNENSDSVSLITTTETNSTS